MIILPHAVDLSFNKRPYLTYIVIALCLGIYYLQAGNEEEINRQANVYCKSINDEGDSLDKLASSMDYCVGTIKAIHEREAHNALAKIKQSIIQNNIETNYSAEQIDEIITKLRMHLERFKQQAPASITGSMMHFPDELNPIPMITSALAHASWEHVIFNLIFFIAFAPAIEIIINNKFKYVVLLVSLSIVTSLSYAISVLISGGEPIPSLGLSGVVTGIIGMSAYLMPQARIKVFVWFFVLVKVFYIPAWILAVWYIGWDTWEMFSSDDYGGINVISHVSGGFTGYLLGYLWFKNRKKEIQDELADEIESQQEERNSFSSAATSSGGRRELKNRQQQKEFKKADDEYMATLHRYVRSNKDSDAIVLMLHDYELQSQSPIIFEQLFERVRLWGDSVTALCLGRLVINLLIENKKHSRALLFVEQCQAISNEFVLAHPNQVLPLAKISQASQQYQVAYLLVRDARERYGEYINYAQCVLIEIDLMLNYLDKKDEAKALVKEQLSIEGNPIKKELILLSGENI